MTWFESPQYLKGIQKIRAMSPDRKAVTQTLINELNSLYAGEDMRRQLEAMRIAAGVKAQDRSVEMAEEGLAMQRDIVDYMEDEGKTAQNLGWLNVGLSGGIGLADLYGEKKKAKRYEDLMNRVYGG